MVLAASIVGSGELIATTTLGAQDGFAALWIILFSCSIKPVVQGELGRYTIATGQPASRDRPRAGPALVAWAGWSGLGVMVALTLLQVGGMYGGVAQVMHLLVPAVPVTAWVGVCLPSPWRSCSAAATGASSGSRSSRSGCSRCSRVRRRRCWSAGPEPLLLPTWRPASASSCPPRASPPRWRSSASRAWARPSCHVPVLVRREGIRPLRRPARRLRGVDRRARGWIRVMHVDILCSLVMYTVATVAFYLLGAGVLNRMGVVPGSQRHIPSCRNIYTQTLGPWALWLFYAGAVITLYGTIFASTAAHARMFADIVRMVGGYRRDDGESRLRWRYRFVVVLRWSRSRSTGSSIARADGGGGRRRAGADAAAHWHGGNLSATSSRAAVEICGHPSPQRSCCGSRAAVMFAFAADHVWSRISSG